MMLIVGNVNTIPILELFNWHRNSKPNYELINKLIQFKRILMNSSVVSKGHQILRPACHTFSRVTMKRREKRSVQITAHM